MLLTNTAPALPAPTSNWRKSPFTRLNRFENSTVETLSTKLESNWTTGLTPIAKSPFLIVSSGGVKNGFYVVKNTAESKLNVSTGTRGVLQARSHFEITKPSYNLHSYGSHLLSSSSNGTVQLYKVDQDALMKDSKGISFVKDIILNDTELSSLPISPPKKLINSVKIKCAKVQPTCINPDSTSDFTKFAAIQAGTLHWYDIGSETNISEKMKPCGISKLSFGSEFSMQALAFGDLDATISVVDYRLFENGSKSIVWAAKDADGAEITDVAFSPFVPYWIASSNELGTVKVWDLRYAKDPFARINAHHHAVTSIDWSFTHCNIISTVGTDNTWKSWGISENISVPLTPEPGYIVGVTEDETGNQKSSSVYGAQLIGYYSRFDAPVMSVASSSYHPDTFYTVSALGTVCAHTVGHKILNAILEHRYETKEERALELAVQNRDLSEAYEILIRHSRLNFAPTAAKLQYEQDMINFCKLKPAIDKSSWKYGDSMPVDLDEVKYDLMELNYGFPPGFGSFTQWTNLVPLELVKKYDLIILRNEVVGYTLEGELEKLMSKLNLIKAGLKFDSDFMDLQSLVMIFKFILTKDFSGGLQFGLWAAQALAEATSGNFSLYADVFHYLIYPTAFDYSDEFVAKDPLSVTDASRQNVISSLCAKTAKMGSNCSILKATKPAAESEKNPLQEILEDAKLIIPMISLELRLMKVLTSTYVQEDIIKAFQSVLTDTAFTGFRSKAVIPFERTVSCFANNLYLGALLDAKNFDEYFGVATVFVINYSGFEYANIVLDQMVGLGKATTLEHLEKTISSATLQLNTILQEGGTNTKGFLALIKSLKDASVLIIKTASHIMDGLENLKSEKSKASSVFQKILTELTKYMLQTDASLIRAFERFDNANKMMCKEFAFTIQEAIKDAAKSIPITSNKARPINPDEKSARGFIIQEEAYAILDRLYKTYLKGDSA